MQGFLDDQDGVWYLDSGEETGTGEAGGALELLGGVELVLIVLLGYGSVICKD